MQYDVGLLQEQTIKRVSLVRLRRDLSPARCLERWCGAHADLVRAQPEVVEYTVDIAAERRPPGAWDALATLRFVDRASLQQFEEDRALREALLKTRDGFAETADVFLVEENRLVGRGGRG